MFVCLCLSVPLTCCPSGLFEAVMSALSSGKDSVRCAAVATLRNIAFHPDGKTKVCLKQCVHTRRILLSQWLTLRALFTVCLCVCRRVSAAACCLCPRRQHCGACSVLTCGVVRCIGKGNSSLVLVFVNLACLITCHVLDESVCQAAQVHVVLRPVIQSIISGAFLSPLSTLFTLLRHLCSLCSFLPLTDLMCAVVTERDKHPTRSDHSHSHSIGSGDRTEWLRLALDSALMVLHILGDLTPPTTDPLLLSPLHADTTAAAAAAAAAAVADENGGFGEDETSYGGDFEGAGDAADRENDAPMQDAAAVRALLQRTQRLQMYRQQQQQQQQEQQQRARSRLIGTLLPSTGREMRDSDL